MVRKLFVPNLREVITFEVCIRDISSDVTLVLDVYGCIGKYQVTVSLHCLLGTLFQIHAPPVEDLRNI